MSAPAIQHVILDRDGVLNRELDSGWVSSPAQWRWEEGSLEALQLLTGAGVQVSVVSNQSGIGRGVVSRAEVDSVHAWLEGELATAGIELTGIYVCPHAPEEGCDCRKPLPGLVQEAISRSGVARQASILIGDDLRDLEAGAAAGIRVALVRTGKGERLRNRLGRNTLVFENLLEAVTTIVENETGAPGAARHH